MQTKKGFCFHSQVTGRDYRVTEYSGFEHAGVSNSYPTSEEAVQVLVQFARDEFARIVSIVAAGSKSWTFGREKKLFSPKDAEIVRHFSAMNCSDTAAALLSAAIALNSKREELYKKLKTAIRSDHPMVKMARRMAGHLSHGWTSFVGETLTEIEENMDASENPDSNFGAGIRPEFYVRGEYEIGDPEWSNGNTIAMGDVSGTGRYDWDVKWDGTLTCDICRPGGVAIHIVIQPGGGAVEVTKGRTEFEDRHIEHAFGVIQACAGELFVRPAMTKSLLSPDAFDAWQKRYQEAEEAAEEQYLKATGQK